MFLKTCEKQKRKASLGTAVPVYIYRKYPASSSHSPINFTGSLIPYLCYPYYR